MLHVRENEISMHKLSGGTARLCTLERTLVVGMRLWFRLFYFTRCWEIFRQISSCSDDW